ncbi:hypothetical protein E2C01_038870 [Portunus trituberculatus]|uniref:Uncharacterized protein n=1 Tax=Portunus trituberculatus TaxID=210409 RepID=A0A5B7FDA3_PORTR|nr:hypothetical protein [Portunus trituberculatus]
MRPFPPLPVQTPYYRPALTLSSLSSLTPPSRPNPSGPPAHSPHSLFALFSCWLKVLFHAVGGALS